MKKKTKSIQQQVSKLHRKLDALVQINRPKGFCEACGCNAQVYHHYIQKSQSTFLRFHKKNLIQLCNACHFAYHTKSDPNIVATIIAKRGNVWQKWIQDNRSTFVKHDKNYLESLKILEKELQ